MRNNDNKKVLINEINIFCMLNDISIEKLSTATVDAYKIIKVLEKIDDEMNQRIAEEYKKKYVTDNVERSYMQFVYGCMRNILREQEQDEEFFLLLAKSLFSRRHYGYGFFEYIDFISAEKISYENGDDFIEYKACYRVLYMSMVEFYTRFYGRFSDNESAIKLICKYYKTEIYEDGYSEEEEEKIAAALVPHIKNAGDVNDIGYAYQGIKMINRYIGRLSERVVDKIISQYKYSEIITIPVRRKQIHTIIENTLNPSKRKNYKMLYLDSISILDTLKDIYNQDQEKQEKPKINFYELYDMSINETELEIKDSVGTEYKLLADQNKWTRSLQRNDGYVVFKVSFSENILVEYKTKKYEIKENLDSDYTLSSYNQKFYLDLKKRFINEEENKYISYKYVYLSNYHGMEERTFCFDRQFEYSNHIIKCRKRQTELPIMVYSDKIDSIQAIVGRNGTGKTSIIDFLGKEFISLMFELEREGATVSYITDRLDGMKNADFLVIFELDGQYYYLTNVGDITVADDSVIVKNYEQNISGSMKRALSKIFYYSNKTESSALFEREDRKRLLKNELQTNEKIWGIKDYSEQFYLQQKIRDEMELLRRELWEEKKEEQDDKLRVFNTELFYQLVFLRDCFLDEKPVIEKLLWKGFSIEELVLGDENDTGKMQTFLGMPVYEINVEMREIFFKEGLFLHYFSSGQYARFNFLSRLYWITSGYSKNTELLHNLKLESAFFSEDIIGEGDSAILFIDEGDLYYHPEWQRKYINDLCKIVDMSPINYKIQILIATNSPFILSDIFEENIVFLADDETEAEKRKMKRTFGQNIHTLLKKNFFMSYTIGEFAREKIVQLFEALESDECQNREQLSERVSVIFKREILPEEVYEKLYNFSKHIGEQVYREHLRNLIENHMNMERPDIKIHFLEKRKQEIEEALKVLKKRSENHDKNE